MSGTSWARRAVLIAASDAIPLRGSPFGVERDCYEIAQRQILDELGVHRRQRRRAAICFDLLVGSIYVAGQLLVQPLPEDNPPLAIAIENSTAGAQQRAEHWLGQLLALTAVRS